MKLNELYHRSISFLIISKAVETFNKWCSSSFILKSFNNMFLYQLKCLRINVDRISCYFRKSATAKVISGIITNTRCYFRHSVMCGSFLGVRVSGEAILDTSFFGWARRSISDKKVRIHTYTSSSILVNTINRLRSHSFLTLEKSLGVFLISIAFFGALIEIYAIRNIRIGRYAAIVCIAIIGIALFFYKSNWKNLKASSAILKLLQPDE